MENGKQDEKEEVEKWQGDSRKGGRAVVKRTADTDTDTDCGGRTNGHGIDKRSSVTGTSRKTGIGSGGGFEGRTVHD